MTESTIPENLICYNHPNRETSLRCNRCDRPICPSCAVRTPTGYRCRECVRSGQKVYETATWWDYPLAFFTAGLLGFLGSLISSFLGFFILLLAPIVGVLIAEVVRFVIRKRRSRGLFLTAAVGTVLGSLVTVLLPMAILLLGAFGGMSLADLFVGLGGNILWQGIYTILVTSTMYYRLSEIQLRM